MKRRDFITHLGGAATGWPFAVRAQQRAKLPRIGFLGLVPEFIAQEGLRDLGYIESTNIVVEWRWAQDSLHENAKSPLNYGLSRIPCHVS